MEWDVSADPLDPVRIWRVGLRTAADLELPSMLGPLLRGVLGRALFRIHGDEVAREIFEPHERAPAFRFDIPVGPPRRLSPGQRWAIRLVTFRPAYEEALLGGLATALDEGLREARAPQRITSVDRLVHGGDDAPAGEDAPPDLAGRAEELRRAEAVVVRLASPVELKVGGTMLRRPRTADLLRATARRVRDLGLDVSTLPRFEEEVEELAGPMRTLRHERHSEAQGRSYALVGVMGAIAVRPTPAQATWLALAEILGVGASTAYGFGVVRAGPMSD